MTSTNWRLMDAFLLSSLIFTHNQVRQSNGLISLTLRSFSEVSISLDHTLF